MMKIAVGSDHGGFQLKEAIKAWLVEKGYNVEDKGTHDEQSCDYPDYGKAVALEVAEGKADKGILVCGTGIGISISANKVRGIRAAVCGDTFSARMSRLHNDANVLAVGQRVTGVGLALDIVEIWLNTDFEGGRHVNRVKKIMQIEEDKA
ncbi:MAG: ribose 5-phosphate isomerase B [Peptococcaceae bacterium]|nr:ribose 5-phosphate isomerase B [Peptococcaceae bacterium]